MTMIALPVSIVNPAPVFNSTGCLRPVPCDSRTFTFVSERCPNCFARFIAAFDAEFGHHHSTDTEPEVETVETGPTFDGDVYHPTVEDLDDYTADLAELDAREDAMAEHFARDRAEAMDSAFSDPWDMVNPCELIEAGGYHSAAGYDH
jgi:hypothetical protein